MSIHKITPFLSDIKTFFKNSDMTDAMQNIPTLNWQVQNYRFVGRIHIWERKN